MSATPARPRWGLILCQIAVPALAIPSAIGVAKFFSVADGVKGWTLQGGIAALGFELTNVGLSILDIRRPELHQVVQRVRFWSVTAAITMNVIAHYAAAAGDARGFAFIPFVLALVASVPLALLYVQLAALLHAISESEHAEANVLAELRDALAKAREELASKVKDLAKLGRDLAEAREQARVELARVSAELAEARAELTRARETHAVELAGARELAGAEAASLRAELAEAREAAAQAREGQAREARERVRLARELEQAREEAGRLRDRSREALVREALSLAASHGWGSTEIAKSLGWPESTVRGWLTTKPASAAD